MFIKVYMQEKVILIVTTDNVSEAYLNCRKELTTLDLSLRGTKALFLISHILGQ